MSRGLLVCCLLVIATRLSAEALTPDRLALIYDLDDERSVRTSKYYADMRHVPAGNRIGLHVPSRDSIGRDELQKLRREMLDRLPGNVQSLLLVWSRPYAAECMSITMAFAAGYRPGFCEPGCSSTTENPLFDTDGWLPADTVGWLPAMQLPSDDEELARTLIRTGIRSDGSRPRGVAFLVQTDDQKRNVRALQYEDAIRRVGGRMTVRRIHPPATTVDAPAISYFTGEERVSDLSRIGFLPGAVADHLTSWGGVPDGKGQMPAMEWLRHGATGTYGTVSEPCNRTEKFPSPAVFLAHYVNGETLLESYWKSVRMPGQGLFLGEPLARPYGPPASAGGS